MRARDDVLQTTCTPRDIAIVGAAAGITAGVVMAMWATLTSVWHGVGLLASFESIGATFMGANASSHGVVGILYGILIHGITAAALGVVFCALLPPNATGGYATAVGLGFGLATLLAMTFVVIPVVNPVLRHAVATIPKSWVIQHILFGMTLGIVPTFWRFYREESPPTPLTVARPHALLVRQAPLPPARRPVTYPRSARARVALRCREVTGPPPERPVGRVEGGHQLTPYG